MNPKFGQDWQNTLEKLEVIESQQIINTSGNDLLSAYSHIGNFLVWFMSLPLLPKIIVIGAVILLTFAMLQALLKLVASIISVALLAILVYLGYKFFVPNSSS